MGSFFCNPIIGKYKNTLCLSNGGQPVGNDKGCTIFRQLFQRFLNNFFTLIVKGRGGFIKNKNRRIL